MGRKGKKKGQSGEGDASSSRQQQESAPHPSQSSTSSQQQQNKPPGGQPRQETSQTQQQRGPSQPPQGAWGQPRQETSQSQQQRGPAQNPQVGGERPRQETSQSQQQRGPPQNPQGGRERPRQETSQTQQQRGPSQPPQGAWGQPRQETSQSQQQRGPAQNPQGAWGQPRQETSQSQQQHGPAQNPQGGGERPRQETSQTQQQRGPQQNPQGAWEQSRQRPDMTGLTSQMRHLGNEPASRGRGRGRGDDRRGRGDGRGRGDDRRGRGDGRGRGDDRSGRGDGSAPSRGGGAWGVAGESDREKRQPSERSPSVASSVGDTASVKSSSSEIAKNPSTTSTVPTKKLTVPEHERTRLMSLIPRRKDPSKAGTAGRPITVFTNMIKIVLGSKFKISATHYDIKFDPDRPKYIKKPTFTALRNTHFPQCWPAFDGRANAYSAGDLPFGDSLNAEVVIFDEEWQKERTVKVNMTKVNVIDLSWLKTVSPGITERERDLTTMQVLDVILRMASYNRAVMVGRSFFQQPRAAFDLSDGMELWIGMFQSAVLGWKPYFNVDVAHKAFPKSENVIEVMKDLCTDRRNGRPDSLTGEILHYYRDKVKQHLTGLKVIFQLPNQPNTKRTVGVNGLDKSAREAVFQLDNGESTTVEKYFMGSKRYRILYPDLPCLWVGSRKKTVLLPPELCKVAPGVVTNRKLGEEQTRRMIRETAKDANTRRDRIMEAFNQMNFNSDPTMKEFGISLAGEFEKVDARVLAPPILQYQRRTATVQKGIWRPSGNFLKPSVIPEKTWTILNLCDRMSDNTLHTFVSNLINHGRSNGMEIGPPKTPYGRQRPPSRDTRQLLQYFEERKKEGIKLIVVVIPGFQADVYPKVKQQAELYAGILTQCVKENTVDKVCGTRTGRPDDATTGNILLKINSKMNGVNHTFEVKTRPACLNVPTIIFGADVTHPSPDATDMPSIAAVAASHSTDVFKYNIMIRLQPPREENILNLEEIVIEQLKIYSRNNEQKKPEKIFYYRDGVSEGQFPTVMYYELQAIRNACKKFGGPAKYTPSITFLVVQKRHHIRLFPTDKRNSDDRNGNVQAGTIVDTTITHPSHIDFYLVSHASIQGTARPTKYRCLWDDNNMSEDEIEKLTYYLCHMFSRCNRSVSYPAPTYYAHLAAFRARALTYGVNIQMNNLEQAQRRNLTLKSDLVDNNPMFFV